MNARPNHESVDNRVITGDFFGITNLEMPRQSSTMLNIGPFLFGIDTLPALFSGSDKKERIAI
jgi:hypothetical protein